MVPGSIDRTTVPVGFRLDYTAQGQGHSSTSVEFTGREVVDRLRRENPGRGAGESETRNRCVAVRRVSRRQSSVRTPRLIVTLTCLFSPRHHNHDLLIP